MKEKKNYCRIGRGANAALGHPDIVSFSWFSDLSNEHTPFVQGRTATTPRWTGTDWQRSRACLSTIFTFPCNCCKPQMVHNQFLRKLVNQHFDARQKEEAKTINTFRYKTLEWNHFSSFKQKRLKTKRELLMPSSQCQFHSDMRKGLTFAENGRIDSPQIRSSSSHSAEKRTKKKSIGAHVCLWYSSTRKG